MSHKIRIQNDVHVFLNYNAAEDKVLTIENTTCNSGLIITTFLIKLYVENVIGGYCKTQNKIFCWVIGFWKMCMQLSNLLHPWAGTRTSVSQKIVQNDIEVVADSTLQLKTKYSWQLKLGQAFIRYIATQDL